MRKISFALLLSLAAIGSAQAQSTPFLIRSVVAPSTTDTSQQMVEDITPGCSGCIVIGTTSATFGSPLPGALTVANSGYANYPTPETPSVEIIAINFVSTGVTGLSDYSMAAIRAGDALPGNGPLVDFSIDNNGWIGMGNAANASINGNASAHLYITDPNNDNYPLIAAYTYSNNKGLIVDQNGLVGIGAYPAIGVGGGTGPYLPVPGNGNITAHLYVTDAAGDGNPLLTTYTNAGNPGLISDGSGNVGIGTATIGHTLEVNGSTATSTFQMTNGATNGYILQSDASGNASWTVPSSIGAGLWTLSGGDIHNNNSGNVGIGTASPAYKLDVNGDASVGNLYVQASTWMTGNTSISQSLNVASNFNVGGTVKIGGAAPATSAYNTYAMSVNGNIVAKKVIVETSDWADRVFDKSYKLTSLSDVEAYVDRNKHLPDVPSECESIDKGIDVGEMNKILLQKVEELTLYMIQQKKEIDALKAKY